MGAAREKDQADFDLERFMDMFDEAMTSRDPRVIDALRSLMMIVTLTRPESAMHHGRNSGPLRRLFEDMHHLNSRMHRLEESQSRLDREVDRQYPRERSWPDDDYYKLKYSMEAAAKMAQHVDQDVIRNVANKINSGVLGSQVKPKGLLDK